MAREPHLRDMSGAAPQNEWVKVAITGSADEETTMSIQLADAPDEFREPEEGPPENVWPEEKPASLWD